MNYEKIVNIPIHNPARAVEMLNDLIYKRVYYLFFVLGEDSLSEDLLNLASDMAGSLTDPTMVVSIPDTAPVISILEGLNDPLNQLSNLSNVAAFTTSIMDSVADVISKNENKVDLVRIWKAWQLAFNSK
ncbi:MAG: hypothetical protein R2757_19650 [Draconibacterium sp.]